MFSLGLAEIIIILVILVVPVGVGAYVVYKLVKPSGENNALKNERDKKHQ